MKQEASPEALAEGGEQSRCYFERAGGDPAVASCHPEIVQTSYILKTKIQRLQVTVTHAQHMHRGFAEVFNCLLNRLQQV